MPHVQIKAIRIEERGENVFCIVETKIEYGNIFHEIRLQPKSTLQQRTATTYAIARI